MVEGRMAKFHGEMCLLEQQWLVGSEDGNTKQTVKQAVASAAKPLGLHDSVKVAGFARFKIGEAVAAAP